MLVCHGAELQHTSALHFAARLPTDALSIPLIRFLLDHGIDIDELEFDGRPVIGVRNRFRDHGTALHVAAKCGSVERIQILVERGADLAKKSRYGYTARDIAQLSEEEDAKVCLETAMRERGLDFEDLVVKDDEEEEEDE